MKARPAACPNDMPLCSKHGDKMANRTMEVAPAMDIINHLMMIPDIGQLP